jgi:chemotaxis protein CheX
MKNIYTQPFVDAAVKVLETMAFTTPKLQEIGPWDKKQVAGQVVGIIGLSNENENLQGFMSVGFTESCICRIVSNMLGEEFACICDEVREAVGEIANMISGQARQGLSAKGIKLQAALPSVISGNDLVVDGSEKTPHVMITFDTEAGSFEIGICIDGLP